MASRKLEVEITGDSRKLDRALGKAETRLQKFGRRADTLSSGAAISNRGGLGSSAAILKGGGFALAAGAIGQQALKATQAASDLNEQVSKTNVVFGTSAAAITDWSKDLATSFGLAQTRALAAASTFGALFHNTGQSTASAAKLSRSVVELGADLASFNNTSVDDALLALRSGLSGEIEPLRRFQVFLTEAAVQQQAMADTGKTNVKQLTQGDKIMARYKLILRQTSQAQGDFARTSGGLANQQRILQAQVANLQVQIGKGLVPALTRFTEVANESITAAGHLGGVLQSADQKSGGFLGDALKNVTKMSFYLNPTGQIFLGVKGINSLFDNTKTQLQDINVLASQFAATIGGVSLNPGGAPTPQNPGGVNGKTGKTPAFGEPGFRTGKAPAVPLGPSASQRNTIFDNKIGRELDRVQDLGPVAAIKALQGIRAEIVAKIAQTKDPTRRLNLGDEVVQINREIKGLNETIAQGLRDKAQRIKDASQALAATFKQQANDIKSAVLDAFDTKVNKVHLARDLKDAQKTLRQAQQLGGAGSIETARRGVQDAQLAIQRQRIEDTTFRVTGGPAGPVNNVQVGNITFNIKTDDPEKVATIVLKKLQVKSRHNSVQGRGRIAGKTLGVN